MTPEQRLHYLDAMGIQVWLPNDVPSMVEEVEAIVEAAPVEPVVEAPVAPTPPPVVESPAPAPEARMEAPPPPSEEQPPAADDEPPAWDEPPPWLDEESGPPPEVPAVPPAPSMEKPAPRPAEPARPAPPPAQPPVQNKPRPAPAAEAPLRQSVGQEVGWEQLESMVRDCTRCELHRTRTNPVFGVGDRQADWMVVGEAPGRDEDLQGEPFVGRAGKLLNAMLWAAGFNREQVYIANILKSRPPNNRDPRPEEVEVCISYLLRQIELIQPKVILAVGRIAAQNLLRTDEAIGRMRGRVHTLKPYGTPVIATYHPAYLLRTPSQKRKAWDDLKLALRVYGVGR